MIRKLFFLLLLNSSAWAVPAYIQSNSVDGATTLASTQNITTGSMIVVVFRCGADNHGAITFTDTLLNPYSTAVSSFSITTSDTLVIAYALNSSAGADTITESGCSGTTRWILAEYSGVAASGALDVVNYGECSVVTSCATASSTTNQNSEVVICGGEEGSANTWTTSAPFTNRNTTTKTEEGDQVLSTIQSVSCTVAGVSDSPHVAFASFKAPAAGGAAAGVNMWMKKDRLDE